MSLQKKFDTLAGVSSAAVAAKTGKTWAEWIALLDRDGAKKMSHQEIVAVLHDKYRVGGWWQQMVTVGYEQARHGRKKGEMADGYQVSANKTVNVPLAALYRHWKDAKTRARWLPVKGYTVSKATPEKSMRMQWAGGASAVSANFYAVGETKSKVSLEHSKLKNAREAAQMKKFWAETLNALKALLEA
jgi:uncharacterized protein YndB with AHSA1/START domain